MYRFPVKLLIVLLSGILFVAASAKAEKPVVIAHRGASGYLPEHTLVAVSLAHGMGADYIEQDIVLSKDFVPIVLHDIHIDTVTDVARVFPGRSRDDGRFYAIDFTLDELRTLQVNERVDAKTQKRVFPKRFPQNQSRLHIPTLSEEIELIQGLNQSTRRSVGIYPEIKKPAWHRQQGYDISPIVIKVLKNYGYESKEDACYLQCFEQLELKRIRGELGVKLLLIQLLGDAPATLRSDDGLAEIATYADGIGPSLSTVFDFAHGAKLLPLVPMARRYGLKVHPYTFRVDRLPGEVGSSRELMRLLTESAKVDGMFTDFPDACVEYLKD